MLSFPYIYTQKYMLIEESEVKDVGEVNPDAIEALLGDDAVEEEEIFIFAATKDEDDDIDIAFDPNPENNW